MRDIAVVILLLGSIVLVFRRPWYGVLVLAVWGYLNPHRYAWGFSTELPVYQILFIAVALSFLTSGKDRQAIPSDWRIPIFYAMWAYFLITTLDAINIAITSEMLIKVSKLYLPLIFTLLLINTREKLFYLIITIAVSFGAIAIKGGIFAVGTGFAYHVYGPMSTHFYGNNEFAIATLMIIPLVILWRRETTDQRIKLALAGAIPLMYATVISSQSRGALLAMVAVVPLLLWHSKRKYLAVPILVLGLAVAAAVLPEQWFGRMQTIENYQQDASAMGRIRAWQAGIEYVLANPLTGAGFDSWVWIAEREWHSAYVEALAEHGFIGFFLWLCLLFGTIISLTRLPRLTRHIPEMKWVANYSYMLRASLVAYAVGAIFLSITYWDLLIHLVFVAVLVKKFALEQLAQYEVHTSPATGRRAWADAGAIRTTGW